MGSPEDREKKRRRIKQHVKKDQREKSRRPKKEPDKKPKKVYDVKDLTHADLVKILNDKDYDEQE
jgi:hypothetical protein